MLSVLVFALVPHRDQEESRVSDGQLGVLQLTWLLSNDDHLAGVTEPKHDDLRKAGMFEVRLGEWFRRKITPGSPAQGDGEDHELVGLQDK